MFFFYCFGDSRVLHVLPHSSPSGRSAVLLPDGGGGRGGGRRGRGGCGGGRFVFSSLDDVALDVRHVALCGGQRRLLTAGVEVVEVGLGHLVAVDVGGRLELRVDPEQAAGSALVDDHLVAVEADEVGARAVPLHGGEGAAQHRDDEQREHDGPPRQADRKSVV